MTRTAATHRLLLVEPENLMRRTVAAVARDLHLARIDEASSVAAAERALEATRFDGLVLSLDERGQALQMLDRLRAGAFYTTARAPVVVMVDACDPGTVMRMKALEVRRILLKPFKVKSVLESVSGLCAA